ncbi:Serine/threonine-protein kinase PrkC [Streptomyces sp. YIM 130001]|uniref:serine/threonine-protein kinase n=1 Tax=Streptomyces sp. YIM 130001 TaxID=2259644 RepID=UPI000E657D16|nr:serine/threonine-protein kinase [Streptomyces sp. YIM 130001]RII08032.1 Serine/threonine-protein kinase PrkC [Streptomyces sp. YIM 130001]
MTSGENEQGDGVGRLLAGRYRVVNRLGRGGMGVVWRAHDEVLGREVAVKELRTFTDAGAPELADLQLRMQREARAAARVRHPGVVAVHDVAEVDGRPLIVMELVDGPSLDDVLRDQGTLAPREAAAIGAKVMDALAAAHRAGVLHRDVKPGNILLERSGRVVLTDFGIATMDDPGDGSSTHLTRSGELVGSLDYLAPERAQGQDPGPASDVWALGATLYGAVEGSVPFRRTSTWSTLTAIVVDPLPDPVRAGQLTPVLQQLMAKDPQTRPDAERARVLLEEIAGASGDETTAALRTPQGPPRDATVRTAPGAPPPGFGPAGAFGHPGTAAPPPGPQEPVVATVPPAGPRRSRRALYAGAAVALVLALAGGGYVLLADSGDPKNEAGAGSGSVRDDPSSGKASQPPGEKTGTSKPEEQGDKKSPSADPEPSKEDGEKGKDKDSQEAGTGGAQDPGKGESEPTEAPDEGSSGSGGGGGNGGGGDPAPAPVCHPAGAGKYNCEVWRAATSYTAGGAEAGVLNSGTNYFYCQENSGRRETHGGWTNVWWARTDDDSGNRNVQVNVVNIKGGKNDTPVPGLPTC